MSDDKIIDLEMKIAHQELEIEKLTQGLFEHHRIIERLEKDLKDLKDRLEGIVTPSDIGPGNEKPPHY